MAKDVTPPPLEDTYTLGIPTQDYFFVEKYVVEEAKIIADSFLAKGLTVEDIIIYSKRRYDQKDSLEREKYVGKLTQGMDSELDDYMRQFLEQLTCEGSDRYVYYFRGYTALRKEVYRPNHGREVFMTIWRRNVHGVEEICYLESWVNKTVSDYSSYINYLDTRMKDFFTGLPQKVANASQEDLNEYSQLAQLFEERTYRKYLAHAQYDGSLLKMKVIESLIDKVKKPDDHSEGMPRLKSLGLYSDCLRVEQSDRGDSFLWKGTGRTRLIGYGRGSELFKQFPGLEKIYPLRETEKEIYLGSVVQAKRDGGTCVDHMDCVSYAMNDGDTLHVCDNKNQGTVSIHISLLNRSVEQVRDHVSAKLVTLSKILCEYD